MPSLSFSVHSGLCGDRFLQPSVSAMPGVWHSLALFPRLPAVRRHGQETQATPDLQGRVRDPRERHLQDGVRLGQASQAHRYVRSSVFAIRARHLQDGVCLGQASQAHKYVRSSVFAIEPDICKIECVFGQSLQAHRYVSFSVCH